MQYGLCKLILCKVLYSFTFELRYEGDWKEGIKEGTGKFTYANGDVFTVNIFKISEPFVIT